MGKPETEAGRPTTDTHATIFSKAAGSMIKNVRVYYPRSNRIARVESLAPVTVNIAYSEAFNGQIRRST